MSKNVGGARPPKPGRAKRVGVPRITSAELDRRRNVQEMATRMSMIEHGATLRMEYIRALYKRLVLNFPKKDWSLEEE